MSLDEMTAKAFRVSSFTAVGHLLHINLRDHLLQHKNEIGQALLNRNPRALAVVNKLNTIDNTYRNFDIEIIARREGCDKSDEELMIVEINENKCRFKLDFSKVYWNSRLSTEHERIIAKLNKSHDIVFDLFAGVGPFSVPAAKAKCKTFANDLNPDSVAWLEVNMKRNKVNPNFFEITSKDAKDFILSDMKSKLLEIYKQVEEEELATKPKIHIVMNLPALAPTFLPHFIGLLKNDDTSKSDNETEDLLNLFKKQSLDHIVYCYCFLKGVYDNPKAEVLQMIEENFGRELNDNQLVDIFRVRNVAPYKEMYRVELRLDEQILFDAKNVVSIMKNVNGRQLLNGTPKKVTIREGGLKRLRDRTTDSPIDDKPKRARITDYCILM